VSALAVLGAILNAWVLTVHTTSVILKSLHAGGDGIVICHQGGLKYLDQTGTTGKKSTPEKNCPICSGVAALHLGIVSPPMLHIAPAERHGFEIYALDAEIVVDHRPQQIFNRGPPLLT